MRKLLFIIILATGCGPTEPEPIIIDTNPGDSECPVPVINNTYTSCLPETDEATIEVMAWNLETFPLSGSTTLTIVADLIESIDVDVIAIQEIASSTQMNNLVDLLPGWEFDYVNLSGNLDLGFLFKTCEIIEFTNPSRVSLNAWPRDPVQTKITHASGVEIYLLNIHLKCCGGQDNYNARLDASTKIKTYIDSQLANENVIVLGDFNDDINSGSPFSNFINDSDNYVFADQSIAEGSFSGWSYPGWPSHIDHILITNELFGSIEETSVLAMDNCESQYFARVSDHRPIMTRINP